MFQQHCACPALHALTQPQARNRMSPGFVCCIPFMVFLLADVDRLGLCQESFSVEYEWNERKWRHTEQPLPPVWFASLALCFLRS
jgi:hypothetical protein